MDKVLHANAAKLLDAAPCSLEMPAGTGKTHLLAAAAATADTPMLRPTAKAILFTLCMMVSS